MVIQIDYPYGGNVDCHFRSNLDYLSNPHCQIMCHAKQGNMVDLGNLIEDGQ